MDHVAKQITDKLYGSEDGLPSYAGIRRITDRRTVSVEIYDSAPRFTEEVPVDMTHTRTDAAHVDSIDVDMTRVDGGEWVVEKVAVEGERIFTDGSLGMSLSRLYVNKDRHHGYAYSTEDMPQWIREIVNVEAER